LIEKLAKENQEKQRDNQLAVILCFSQNNTDMFKNITKRRHLKMKKMNLTVLTILASVFVSTLPTLYAGTIQVVNENKKNLKIRIKAEGNIMNESLISYVQIIPAEQFSSFIVTAGDLDGKTHYSIKGDTNPFTVGDKCNHLSVLDNYRVTFINDVAGTTCVAEKIN
jgi:hypothetical protein